MKRLLLVISFLSICAATDVAAQVAERHNSFTPGKVWTDNNGVHINAHGAGIYYEKGVYWMFGEHKVESGIGNTAQVGVHCYSSRDLYNWKDEGIVLNVIADDQSHPITRGCIIERPKVVYNKKTGKYVMWFHLELKERGYEAANYGVAISDKVTGPYKFVRNGRVNGGKWPENMSDSDRQLVLKYRNGDFAVAQAPEAFKNLKYFARDFEGGQMSRDMTIFVDDNGKAYHIYSSEDNETQHIAELTDDYQSHSGRYIRIFAGRSMEAAAICQREDKYYFIGSGCTGWDPNAARMGVADNIMGEWRELENPCVGEGSDITFGGQSTYIIPVQGIKDAYIFCADIWRPKNPIEGGYMWLPMEWNGDQIRIVWMDEWKLKYFDKRKKEIAKLEN